MSRRGVGLAGVRRAQEHKATLQARGRAMEEESLNNMQQSLEEFQRRLEEFAIKHKDNINKNPIFRQQFTKMCKTIGVDPLASNKAVWAKSLGTEMTDFYYELGIHIIEACLKTKHHNGGIISLDDLTKAIYQKQEQKIKLTKSTRKEEVQPQSSENIITKDDIKAALDQISILGNGYRMLDIGGTDMVISVPVELQTDHIELMKIAAHNDGWVDIQTIQKKNNWQIQRITAAVNMLTQEGMCWVDEQGYRDHHNESSPNQQSSYYTKWFIPSIWLDKYHTKASQ